MLKIGLDNYAHNATASATIETLGHTSDSVISSDVTSWVGVNACTLTLAFSAPVTIDLLTLHRIEIVTNVTITAKLVSATVWTGVFTPTSLKGIDSKTLYTTCAGTIDSIEFAFTGTGYPSIGYIWAGTSQTIKFEKLQLVDNSNDIVNVTLGNYAGSSKRPNYRSAQITLQKKSIADISGFIRAIIERGYGVPRPAIILTSTCFLDDVMLCILDSGKYQYDVFDSAGDRIVNTTIGLSEVFGGI